MRRLDYALYAVVVFAWSTSWLALKMQLGVVAPEVSLAWRFGLAAAVVAGWAFWSGVRMGYGPADHGRFLLLGASLFSCNFLGFYYGGLSTPSGLLAVVFSTASVFNLLLGALLLQQKIERQVAAGGVLGFAGVLLMFAPRIFANAFDASALLGLALCILGTLIFCLGNVVSARAQRRGIPVLAANAWSMGYGALILAIIALLFGRSFAIEPTLAYIGALLWLALISSVIAFAAYLTLLGRIGAARAGYATVMFPVFALLISTIFEGYQWTPLAWLGLIGVLAGNVLVLLRRKA